MLIDQVIESLVDRKVDIQTTRGYEADFVVYMDRDFYHKCKAEIVGEVLSNAVEFRYKNTVWGYPLFLVTSPWGGNHPDYQICEVG